MVVVVIIIWNEYGCVFSTTNLGRIWCCKLWKNQSSSFKVQHYGTHVSILNHTYEAGFIWYEPTKISDEHQKPFGTGQGHTYSILWGHTADLLSTTMFMSERHGWFEQMVLHGHSWSKHFMRLSSVDAKPQQRRWHHPHKSVPEPTELMQNTVHQSLEGCQSRAQPKRHAVELEQSKIAPRIIILRSKDHWSRPTAIAWFWSVHLPTFRKYVSPQLPLLMLQPRDGAHQIVAWSVVWISCWIMSVYSITFYPSIGKRAA